MQFYIKKNSPDVCIWAEWPYEKDCGCPKGWFWAFAEGTPKVVMWVKNRNYLSEAFFHSIRGGASGRGYVTCEWRPGGTAGPSLIVAGVHFKSGYNFRNKANFEMDAVINSCIRIPHASVLIVGDFNQASDDLGLAVSEYQSSFLSSGGGLSSAKPLFPLDRSLLIRNCDNHNGSFSAEPHPPSFFSNTDHDHAFLIVDASYYQNGVWQGPLNYLY